MYCDKTLYAINQPAVLSGSIVGTNIICYGAATGAADLTMSGGTSPYTYHWSNAATTQDLGSIAAGTYSVTVTDANACTTTASTTLTQPSQMTTSLTATNPVCGGLYTGSLTSSVSNGASPYSYLWSTGATTANASNLPPSTCTLTVTDVNGCSSSTTKTLSLPSTYQGNISANFNSSSISAGNYIWFTCYMKVNGVGSSAVTIKVMGQTVNSANFSIVVPDALITIDPSTSSATTTYNGTKYVSTFPKSISGNVLVSGVAYLVPNGGLPGSISNITWNGSYTASQSGISINWQFGSAVYTSFSSNPTSLGIKPCDDGHASSAYQNSDPAGTPENYKAYVISGAKGGGGTNYNGGNSSTGGITPCYTGHL